MMVCCFIGAWRLLSLSLERAGENPEIAEKMVVTAAVAGIVGSRLNYILSSWGDFKADPMGMLFSGAGFVFYGGFLLAMLAVVVMLWRQKRPVLLDMQSEESAVISQVMGIMEKQPRVS